MLSLPLPAWLKPAPDSMVAHMRRAGHQPQWQALNIIWSIWLFLTPLFTDVGPPFAWSLALGYPLFMLLFWLVHVRPYSETNMYVMALTLLACVSVPFNSTAWSYAVFACVYVPYFGSWRGSALKIIFIQALMLLEAWWLGWPWFISAMLVGVCSSAGFGALSGRINAIKNASQLRSNEEVRRLAALAERERIGRDLHDLLGHTLSLITLKLELSRKLFDRDHDKARQELIEAERVARKALAEVRSAVTGIRATDLAGELAAARLMLESSEVSLLYQGPGESIPATLEPVLAMAVREAVTNIARHARARRTLIQIDCNERDVDLRIADDGRGGVSAFGNGLNGMRERIESLGGSLSVESRRGKGTRLQIRLPMPKADVPADATPESASDTTLPAVREARA